MSIAPSPFYGGGAIYFVLSEYDAIAYGNIHLFGLFCYNCVSLEGIKKTLKVFKPSKINAICSHKSDYKLNIPGTNIHYLDKSDQVVICFVKDAVRVIH